MDIYFARVCYYYYFHLFLLSGANVLCTGPRARVQWESLCVWVFFGCKNKNARAFGFTFFCTTNVRDLLILNRNCIYIKGDKIKLANDDGTDYDGNNKKMPLEIAGKVKENVFAPVCRRVPVYLPITKAGAARIESLASYNACKAIRIVSVSYS